MNVSDRKGARTYFWQRTPQILRTLDTADLSLLEDSRILYADWYDGDHVLRAMDEAKRRNIPIFVNLEHGHKESDVLKKFAERATFCQAVTDDAQLGGKQALLGTARKLLKSGIQTAIITLAKGGCLVAEGEHIVRVFAPLSRRWMPAVQALHSLPDSFMVIYKGWDLEVLCPFCDRGCHPQGDAGRFEDVPRGADHGIWRRASKWSVEIPITISFEIIDRILSIPEQVAKQGKNAQERFLRDIHFPRKKKKDDLSSTRTSGRRGRLFNCLSRH